MACRKQIQKKINRLWHPQSVTAGKPVATDEATGTCSLVEKQTEWVAWGGTAAATARRAGNCG
ncbi:MAG: hypothetical protein LBL97_01675 [Prevotellaceae bacterium]|nr:hypothetical protein [Prevotellaceae bacterium]